MLIPPQLLLFLCKVMFGSHINSSCSVLTLMVVCSHMFSVTARVGCFHMFSVAAGAVCFHMFSVTARVVCSHMFSVTARVGCFHMFSVAAGAVCFHMFSVAACVKWRYNEELSVWLIPPIFCSSFDVVACCCCPMEEFMQVEYWLAFIWMAVADTLTLGPERKILP